MWEAWSFVSLLLLYFVFFLTWTTDNWTDNWHNSTTDKNKTWSQTKTTGRTWRWWCRCHNYWSRGPIWWVIVCVCDDVECERRDHLYLYSYSTLFFLDLDNWQLTQQHNWQKQNVITDKDYRPDLTLMVPLTQLLKPWAYLMGHSVCVCVTMWNVRGVIICISTLTLLCFFLDLDNWQLTQQHNWQKQNVITDKDYRPDLTLMVPLPKLLKPWAYLMGHSHSHSVI